MKSLLVFPPYPALPPTPTVTAPSLASSRQGERWIAELRPISTSAGRSRPAPADRNS